MKDIAILGYGVVGSGAYEVLQKAGVLVKKVLDIRPHDELKNVWTQNFEDILQDSSIRVVAEAIGGLEPAHTYAVKTLSAGKHFVSSNKHLICTYYDELHALAQKNGVSIRYTSAVGGGIPWLYNLKRVIRCDRVTKVRGILNGTTNYILDAMATSGRDFAEALKEAQTLGYAEADPSADIDGPDVARKIAISASDAFHTIVKEKDVAVFGLRNVRKKDISFVSQHLQKTIRYFGCAVKNDNRITTYVEPVLLNLTAPEANVCKNYNMITLFSDCVDRLSFYGQGAGKYPTGSALAQDILDVLEQNPCPSYAPQAAQPDFDLVKRKYYIRTSANLASDAIESEQILHGERFLQTKEMSIRSIHTLAKQILAICPDSFFAGIE